MKKRRTIMWIVMCSMLSISACGLKNNTLMDTNDVTKDFSKEVVEKPVELVERDLTTEELRQCTEFFNQPGNNGFLLSNYDTPLQVDLNSIFYNGATVREVPGEQQIQAYLKENGEEELYTDLVYCTKKNVNEYLKKKTNYTYDEMVAHGNKLDMQYIETEDAFFNQVGDTNMILVECTSGKLYSDQRIVLECKASDYISDYAEYIASEVTLKNTAPKSKQIWNADRKIPHRFPHTAFLFSNPISKLKNLMVLPVSKPFLSTI